MNPRWSNQTVAVVASGPSLRGADLAALKNVPTIAINSSWTLVPFAEILYAADAPWWEHYRGVSDFAGERWTQHRGPNNWPARAEQMGLTVIRSVNSPGVSLDPALIHTGYNSAYQALNLAVLAGASRILLFGVDLTGQHWFGNHPAPLHRVSPYDNFRRAFESAAPQLRELDIEVVNCSPRSTLDCFPKLSIAEAIATIN